MNYVVKGVEGLEAKVLKVKVEINLEEWEKNNEVLRVKVEINLEEHVWKWKEANVAPLASSVESSNQCWCIVSCPTTAI